MSLSQTIFIFICDWNKFLSNTTHWRPRSWRYEEEEEEGKDDDDNDDDDHHDDDNDNN